jgi:fucose permease
MHGPIPTPKKIIKFFITECLQRAGEIFLDRTAIEEINDDKFGQLLRNKTVHLLSLFLMLYMGVEVTIGGILFVLLYTIIVTSLITVNQDGL